jgi:hypothetical protein
MKIREANKVDRKSGGSPIKGLSFPLSDPFTLAPIKFFFQEAAGCCFFSGSHTAYLANLESVWLLTAEG